MPPTRQKYVTGALGFAASTLFLIRCGAKKDPSALPDLPPSDVQKLQLVPNTHLLATRSVQLPPAVPPVPSLPPPPCAADDITKYYSVEADYPVTVCQSFLREADDVSAGFVAVRDPTHKVLTSSLPPDVQSVVGKIRWAGGTVATLWSCRTSSGPWQGSLSAEYGCIGTCSPLNALTLNTPNPVDLAWYGSIDDPPPGVQYVHPPTLEGSTDLGSCHGLPSAKKK